MIWEERNGVAWWSEMVRDGQRSTVTNRNQSFKLHRNLKSVTNSWTQQTSVETVWGLIKTADAKCHFRHLLWWFVAPWCSVLLLSCCCLRILWSADWVKLFVFTPDEDRKCHMNETWWNTESLLISVFMLSEKNTAADVKVSCPAAGHLRMNVHTFTWWRNTAQTKWRSTETPEPLEKNICGLFCIKVEHVVQQEALCGHHLSKH